MTFQLLTKQELAKHMRVSIMTIWRWEKQGMPVIRVANMNPRYNLSEVEQWLTEMSNRDMR